MNEPESTVLRPRVHPGVLVPAASREIAAAIHSSVRRANLGLVTATLFDSGGGLSRADIAARTGLTRATVSRLVQELLDSGIIVEGDVGSGSAAGRPATPLFPADRTLAGVGLEINVDRIGGVALNLRGEVIARFAESADLEDCPPEVGFGLLLPSLRGLLQRLDDLGVRNVVGVGLGVPGVVDQDTNTVVSAPNLGWEKVQVPEYLGSTLGSIPFAVDNDANLQALAVVADPGLSDAGSPSYLYLSGDVGIGGALVRRGEMVRGPRGWAGEIGHTTVDPNGPRCHCGSRGCLERYAGKRAIVDYAGISQDVLAADPNCLVHALEDGDPAAREAVRRAGWALGIAIANAVNLLDVETAILGTSLAPLFPWLQGEVQRELRLRVLGAESRNLALRPAPPLELPAATGGAILALRRGLAQVFNAA